VVRGQVLDVVDAAELQPALARRLEEELIAKGLETDAERLFTGMAAVPFLPYMQSLQIARDELVQGMGIMFVVIMGALAIALVQQNVLTTTNALGSALALAPTFLGVWLGQKVRDRKSVV